VATGDGPVLGPRKLDFLPVYPVGARGRGPTRQHALGPSLGRGSGPVLGATELDPPPVGPFVARGWGPLVLWEA